MNIIRVGAKKIFSNGIWFALLCGLGGIVHINFLPEINDFVWQFSGNYAIGARIGMSLFAFALCVGANWFGAICGTFAFELVKATLKAISFQAVDQFRRSGLIIWATAPRPFDNAYAAHIVCVGTRNWRIVSVASLFFGSNVPYLLYPLSCIQLE